MKKMILFSSILMISAMLYGAVDYFISDRSSKLNGLYEPIVTASNVENRNSGSGRVSYANSENFRPEHVSKNIAEKTSVSVRQVALEKFSRAALVEIPESDSLETTSDSVKIVLTAAQRLPYSSDEKKYFVNSDIKK